MKVRESAIWLSVLVVGVMLVGAGSAAAQMVAVNKCAAAKTRCIMGRTHVCGVVGVKGMLVCHQRADSRSRPVDPECLNRAVSELNDCFMGLDRKEGCLTTGDAASIQARIEDFTLDVVQQLDPNHPALVTNKCSVGKMKAVGDATAARLECFMDAFRGDAIIDPSCIEKPLAHFAAIWSKLEDNGGCLTVGDIALLDAKIDDFVAQIIADLDPDGP
jgi:hypothetical protein